MVKSWRNVVVGAGVDASFSPPLDGIYVTVAGDPVGQEETFTLYVDGVDSGVVPNRLGVGYHQIGHITRINATGNALAYVGVRQVETGQGAVINDSVPEGGGG